LFIEERGNPSLQLKPIYVLDFEEKFDGFTLWVSVFFEFR